MRQHPKVRTPRRLSLLVAFALGASSCRAPRAPQPLPEEARTAGTTWLVISCGLGERNQLEAILVRYKAELEPFFLEALDKGPDPKLAAGVQQAASTRFELRQEALKTGKGLGLSDADLQAAREVTREQYLAQEHEDFILRYRSQAVAALGIVDGAKGRAALEALARDQNSPLNGSAQEALRHLQEPGGNPPVKR